MDRRFMSARKVEFGILALMVLISHHAIQTFGAGQVVGYWGQEGDDKTEGSLAALCASGNYGIVIIAYLSKFGRNQSPVLDLGGHCDAPTGACQRYASEIATCQKRGIRVLLSLGGEVGGYGFDTADEARLLAQDIWDNYMGGSSSNSPLGEVNLDGLDLRIFSGGHRFYADLGGRLREIAQDNQYKYLYFGVSPQCPCPDPSLGPDSAGKFMETNLVDLVFVQFYNNPGCDIRGGIDDLVRSWSNWITRITASKPAFYISLPASPSAGEGFIDTKTLKDSVVPSIKTIGNYSGVALWAPSTNRTFAASIKSIV
ncbi:protein MpGH18.4 [Marchantia polymorpha subsp. ruderalis]|uniref:GH18 domain-containing protein n=1 Tax=Marchantia polymorpha TaxID=3197 RepID=A0A2R6XH04_MARPO|nr:hypothetical protein MARPO_0015s0159 [Marchantia polymorpha]BBN01604.1 hypothetical protein Mp_2g08740 [Marchantia polymorpha subsp. ruderalis]|eukprot:PTQ45371.1 hypothetical protein MARPO_0015s0159 [Marchantia polymorpha]